MIIALAIDDLGGMTFNKRRVSRDKELIRDLIEQSEALGSGVIYVNEYSEPLFSDAEVGIISVPDPLEVAGEAATVFIENKDPSPYAKKAEKFLIYKWNRRYPSDLKFTLDLKKAGFKLVATEDFAGNSHEKITREVYTK